MHSCGTASPPRGTGRVFAHGIAIGRLVDVKYTAASAGSPCTKIAAVAHAGIDQRVPSYLASTTLMDSITTASRGTSLRNGPPAPVGILAIFVTTSIPDTTLPNTA